MSLSARIAGNMVSLEWETGPEADTVGFHVFRMDSENGPGRQVNKRLLPGLLVSPGGGTYRYVDNLESSDPPLYYRLIRVDSEGRSTFAGQCEVKKGTSRIDDAPDTTVYVRTPHRTLEQQAASTDNSAGKRTHAARQTRQSSSIAERARITVRQTGLHRVSSGEIAAALGVSESQVSEWIGSARIELSCQGNDVAWLGETGNSGILFHGETIDSIYTWDNVYWLQEGNNGVVMTRTHGNQPSPVPETLTFRERLHFEQQAYAPTAVYSKAGEDFWVWDYLFAGYPGYDRKTLTFELQDPGTSSNAAIITTTLHGGANTSAYPDNHVCLYLNGTAIGEKLWDGKTECVVTSSVSQSLLLDDSNALEVEALLDTDVPYSFVYIDSFEVEYDRQHAAVNGSLTVHDNTNAVATVSGLAETNMTVLNITDAYCPSIIDAVTIDGAPDAYRASFEIASSESRYLATVDSAVLSPASIEGDFDAGLTDAGNEADYIIITPSALLAGSTELASRREAQGLDTRVVDVVDVYNEFNNGIANPDAIQEFLAYTYSSWAKPPQYVLLAGEGSYDYKDYLGNGDCLIPSMPVGSFQGLLFSDIRMADTDGDGDPEMSIGRLPVMNATEMAAVIDKIVAYEDGGTWKSRGLFLADNPDAAGDFSALSDAAAAFLPTNMAVEKVYLEEHTLSETTSMTIDGLNAGCSIFNYIGHGHAAKLADEGILEESDLSSLTNSAGPPLVLAMTCDFGKFAQSGYDSLSESLVVQSQGGCVGVWSSIGLAWSSESRILNEEFLETSFSGDVVRMGDGIVAALQRYGVEGGVPIMRYSYNLLGDPATIVYGSAALDYDFGDAPGNMYPTDVNDDGARHAVVAGLYLGSSIDAETNGPSESAGVGDDQDGTEDEDGVVFSSGFLPGESASVVVIASTDGVLNAWIDFNGDGDWGDAGEQLFDDFSLSAGSNSLTFSVSPTMTANPTYARFRFNSSGNLSPLGPADDGEVEDYQVARQPTLAVISSFTATGEDGKVVVRWRTSIESGTGGFLLERKDENGLFVRLNAEPIVAFGTGDYSVVDDGAVPGKTYTYQLVELAHNGNQCTHGPYMVTVTSELSAFEQWQQARLDVSQLDDPAISGADADADCDGHTTYEEFLAGTDPLDSSSVLMITAISQGGDGVVIRWTGESGKNYAIEGASSPSGDFTIIVSGLDGSPPENEYNFSADTNLCIFRVRLDE
jgi:hypothetical protein